MTGAGIDGQTRDLVIDMTPACVNRTAIYHIALDTAANLSGVSAGWQYRGQIERPVSDLVTTETIRDAFFRDVWTWAEESVHIDELEIEGENPDGLRRLYFDPIYTLYRPLFAGDIVFVLDLSPLTNPEWHNGAVSRVYERAFRKLLSSSARIVSISHNCTAALRSNFAIPARDIVTVPLYVRDLGKHEADEPVGQLKPRRYLLFVGSLEVRKNLVGLIHAFALSGLAESGWRLAIAGGDGQGAQTIRQAALGLKGVDLLGFVSDAELSWLYANAAAFVYPSFLEGFGLPLVEAMAHGIPCVASATGASREICEDLGILVDPYETPSVVDGILRCTEVANEMTQECRGRLIARANSYSFDRYMKALVPALS